MKNYIIQEKEGHHVVTMFTDAQMKMFENMAVAVMDAIREVAERIRGFVQDVWDGIQALVEKYNVETLEELEEKLNENITDSCRH